MGGGIWSGIKSVVKAVVKVVVTVVKAVVKFMGTCHNIFGPKTVLSYNGIVLRGDIISINPSGIKCVGKAARITASAEVRKSKVVACNGSNNWSEPGCFTKGGTITKSIP